MKVYAELTDEDVARTWLKNTNQGAVDWKTLTFVMQHPAIKDLVIFDTSGPTYRLKDQS